MGQIVTLEVSAAVSLTVNSYAPILSITVMEMAEVLIIRGWRFMNKKLSAILRAVGALGAVTAIVGGVTFAALSSSATLAQSTISTANADLNIYNFSTNAWANSAPGFNITGLVPGTGVTEEFYLQNDGDTALTVKARVPVLPAAPEGGYGFTGFENVTVTITGEGCVEPPVQTNLLALNSGDVALPCNPLAAGVSGDSNADVAGNYDIKFDINSAAITGESAGVGPFDIVFTGTAVAPTT